LKVTPEVVERIERLRRLGRRIPDIAQLCGLSELTVKKVLKTITKKIGNRNARNRDGN
jgi:DNA-binding CsgD family transcriptional regulator